MTPGPGWLRLWRHSYRLGLRWLVREAHAGWPGARVGLQRLLVPLDPWRYYELGKVADAEFGGRCLDVGSPKLLPSLLQHEGSGEWTAIDLFEREVRAWGRVDPGLGLEVRDATALPYPDESFDHCVCISVVEHVPGEGDSEVMSEIWRTLKPGGVLHLTTDVALEPGETFIEREVYGEASERMNGRVFFKRDYSDRQLDARLLALPWEVMEREYASQIDPSIEAAFYRRAPWSYLYGGLLRLRCADNFATAGSASVLGGRDHGVVYLRLRKPGHQA